ncbi:MAG: response regulator [Solirubrobacteraceae bacterium]
MRILVVEDEPKMAALLKRGLHEHGLFPEIATSGEAALAMSERREYDAVLLDVMLPGMDGFATCTRLRERGVATPVMMLTARGAVQDRVNGLDGGADDYLVKPFSFTELLARLRALARRRESERAATLRAGDLTLDPVARSVMRGDVRIELSEREFALLEAFMRRPGHVLSRVELLEQAWEADFEHRSNVIDVYVRYLRCKIDRPYGTNALETVRGAGYRLRRDGGR